MPSIGAPEMIFILVVLLLVFGASRLPEIGRSMGRAITEFKQGVSSEDKAKAGPAEHGESGAKNA